MKNNSMIAAYLAASKADDNSTHAQHVENAVATLKTEDANSFDQDGNFLGATIADVNTGGHKKLINAVNDGMSAYASKGILPWSETLKVEEANGVDMTAREVVSKVFNGLTSNVDEFTNVFYPVFMSKELSNTFTMSYQDAKYVTKFTSNGYETVSALDVAYDRDVLENNNTRIYPVYDDSTRSFLDGKATEKKTVNGVEVNSAAYLFGKDINLIDAAKQGFKIAGIEDNISTIANTIWLEGVNLVSTKDDAEVGSANIAVKAFTGSKLNGSFQGAGADFTCNFDHIVLVPVSKFLDNAGAGAFDGHDNYKIAVRLGIHGNGNITKRMIKLHSTEASIVDVYLDDKKLIDTDTKKTDLLTKIGDLSARSFDLEIYAANTTLSFLGNTMIVEDKTKEYAIPFKTPTSVKAGILKIYDGETDASLLAGMLSQNGDQIAGGAVSEFFHMIETAKANNGRKGDDLQAIGNEFIPAYYNHDSLDLTANVNNVETQDMPSSVKTSIIEAIKSLSLQANRDTKINAIVKRASGNKIRYAWVGDETNVTRAGGAGTVYSDDTMDIVLVQSEDKHFKGKLIGSVVSSNPGSKEPNLLSCGFTGVVPTTVTEITKTIGADSINFTVALPRFDSITLLNFAMELELVGIDKIYTHK